MSVPVKPRSSALDIRQAKGQRKIAMLTAYDFPFASLVDGNGVDIVLVGDSLGMVVLGEADTLSVTLDDMIRHTKAVVGAVQHSLVVADMPFMTYEAGVEAALANAARLAQATGVRAVKLEGGAYILPQVRALVQSGIAVMGHLGLTPQRAAVFGGFKVQGRTAASAEAMLADAKALEEAGCFALVLEAVPGVVAEYITQRIGIPTIGIGAGAGCDGQVLVLHDMLGLTSGHVPKFVKQYANLKEQVAGAVKAYVVEVQQGQFPAEEHGFAMPEAERNLLLGHDKKND